MAMYVTYCEIYLKKTFWLYIACCTTSVIQWNGCFEMLITLILIQLLQIISILEIRAINVAIRSVNCEFLLWKQIWNFSTTRWMHAICRGTMIFSCTSSFIWCLQKKWRKESGGIGTLNCKVAAQPQLH